jgi:hypothetical protein
MPLLLLLFSQATTKKNFFSIHPHEFFFLLFLLAVGGKFIFTEKNKKCKEKTAKMKKVMEKVY